MRLRGLQTNDPRHGRNTTEYQDLRHQRDHQPTDDPRTANERATTNKKEKKEKNEKKYSPHSDEWRLAELLLNRIVERKPDFRRPELGPWAGEISRMIRPAQDVEP